MSKLSKKDSTLLAVIGLVAVLGGLFWFYVKPARTALAETTTKVSDAQGRVVQLESELARLIAPKTAKAGGPKLVDELRLAKAYPYSSDQAAAILQFEDVARQTKVTLSEAKPDQGADFAGVTGTTFNIKVNGRFFAVQDFIQRIHDRVLVTPAGKLKVRGRLVAVTRADLKPVGGTGGATATTTASSTVEATITIVAFSHGSGAGTGGASAPGQTPTSNATPSTPSGQGGTPS